MLVPIIYVKIGFNVVKLADAFQKFELLSKWLIGGPFYLLYGVGLDMYNFVRILKDYKMDDDPERMIEDAEEISDKIIIYNEIIEVLKSIYFIFK